MVSAKGRPYDYGLRLYRDLFDLEALHFGMWEEGEEVNLDNIRVAQQRYTDRLLGQIPEGVKTVLDVGCGTGATSEQLLERGYEVEALSPCEYQEGLVKERLGDRIVFHRSTFEKLKTDKRYDLILMSESNQYIEPTLCFKQVRALLEPGGHLLMSDYFRKEKTRYYRACHVLGPWLKQVEEDHFEILADEDITEAVVPMLEFARGIYDSVLLPIANVAGDWALREYPRTSWLGQRLLRKKVDKLKRSIYEDMPEKYDGKLFAERMTYRIMMLRPAEFATLE
jgi:2-polyprenyl-3-methyl-5-hydroxy-6-metoxy-1,4-benzoquinol methylase